MADDKRLSREQHYARHCTGNHLTADRLAVKALAFEPKPNDPEVSGNWLEYHGIERADQIVGVCCDLVTAPRTVKEQHKLAILRAGDIEDIGAANNDETSAHHDPNPRGSKNPSHAVIKGISIKNAILQQRLADKATESLVAVILL